MPVRHTREFLGSLAFRLLALLSLALMPIGAIAVFQTSQIAQQVRDSAVSALLADTHEAVELEKDIVDRAFGAAEVAGALTREVSDNTAACGRRLREFIDRTDLYVYAGLLPRSGLMACSSSDTVMDASGSNSLTARFDDAIPFADAIERGPVSGQSVLVIGQPVMVDGALSHFVLLSLPRSRFSLRRDVDPAPVSVVTFSASGEILSDRLDQAGLRDALPEGVELAGPDPQRGVVFEGKTQSGKERVFSIVPVHAGVVFAVASWPKDRLGLIQTAGFAPWLFPVVMWLATLVVTYIAINLLVVRHVRSLGRRMRRFARSRVTDDPRAPAGRPAEFDEMHDNFLAMADSILRDEAEIEDALREKTLLLREVHHRVKNNLQLIASIMNMQIRRTESAETGEVVRRLQDRVLGLAAVHRQMYRSETLADVPVDDLLDEVLSQSLRPISAKNISVETSFASLALVPDQAVPLALLLAEVASNALMNMHPEEQTEPWISATLQPVAEGQYRLALENSLAPDDADLGETDGESKARSGLGGQLIRAFSAQIEGEVTAGREADRFVFAVAFTPKRDMTSRQPERAGAA